MPNYERAHEVAQVASKLIANTHKHLASLPIEYVWRDKASKSGDKVTLGKARKVSGLNAFLSEHGEDFYVIEIAADTWKDLTSTQQLALVDHELCHLAGRNLDTDKLELRKHDVEEFAEVIARHGVWTANLELFAKQLSFEEVA